MCNSGPVCVLPSCNDMVVSVCLTYNTYPVSDIFIGVLYHIVSDMLYFLS